MRDRRPDGDPSESSWMFLLAEHNRPLSGYGAHLQRELGRLLGAREAYPTLHLTIQKFEPLSLEDSSRFWDMVRQAAVGLAPFDLYASNAFVLYSEFRKHHIAKLVVTYGHAAKRFIELVPSMLESAGAKPLYTRPSELVTFLGDVEHHDVVVPDSFIEHKPVFTVDSLALSRYTPRDGFEISDRLFLTENQGVVGRSASDVADRE